MCGIIIKSDTGNLKVLFDRQKHRGTDGAGIFWIGESLIGYKIVDMDLFFNELENGSYYDVVTDTSGMTDEQINEAKENTLYKNLNLPFVFHHRKKSIGAIETEFNHPFIFKRGEKTFVGVHNGTSRDIIDFYKHASKIFNVPELVVDEFNEKIEVDSQYIISFLSYILMNSKNDANFVKMAKNFADEFSIGVVVIAVYNTEKTLCEGIYIIKNKERSLYVDFENKIITSEIIDIGNYREFISGCVKLDNELNVTFEAAEYSSEVYTAATEEDVKAMVEKASKSSTGVNSYSYANNVNNNSANQTSTDKKEEESTKTTETEKTVAVEQ